MESSHLAGTCSAGHKLHDAQHRLDTIGKRFILDINATNRGEIESYSAPQEMAHAVHGVRKKGCVWACRQTDEEIKQHERQNDVIDAKRNAYIGAWLSSTAFKRRASSKSCIRTSNCTTSASHASAAAATTLGVMCTWARLRNRDDRQHMATIVDKELPLDFPW